MEPIITLGGTYRDRVTGYEGIATQRAEYFTGLPRVTLERKGDAQQMTFDEERLEKVEVTT